MFDKMFAQARMEEKTGRWGRAESTYRTILASDPKNIAALVGLAIALDAQGNSKDAKVVLKKANKLAPDDMDVIRAKQTLAAEQSAEVRQQLGKKASGPLLNILYVQNSPCIRNYKQALAMRGRGHKVTLGFTDNSLSQQYLGMNDEATYDDMIRILSHKHLWEISQGYDIVHCHNEPDELTVAALVGQCPIIHDTHDLISLRDINDPAVKSWEGIAQRGADGRLYTTPYQLNEAENMYAPESPSAVLYNYVSKGDLPSVYHGKLSQEDGNIHIVYEGGLGQNHRDFNEIFFEIASYGAHLHIFPSRYNSKAAEIFAESSNIHYNYPKSPKEIMEEMTKFDIGIIPWNLEKGNKRFLDSTVANKLFEYLASGLPVAASNIRSYNDYFSKNQVGCVFDSVKELMTEKLPLLLEMTKTIDFSEQVYTVEDNIERVEQLYYRVLDQSDSFKKRESHKQYAPVENVSTQDDILESFDRFQDWLLSYGWDGYDPYDAQDLVYQFEKSGKKLPKEEEKAIMDLNTINPMLLREKMKIPKKRIAKGLGLLMGSWAVLYQVFGKEQYLEEAKRLADWLLAKPSPGYDELCWGYPFDWQSVILIPKNTPSAVVSTAVGDGLWQLFQVTRDERYLDACASICRFICKHLNRDDMGEKGVCFSYTPIDDYHVHNANLFCGEFLARVGRELENEEWLKLAERVVDYAISEQNPDGSIYYWGRVQRHFSPNKKVDHYHTGFELRCLTGLYQHLGLEKILRCRDLYLNFYRKNFVLKGGFPNLAPASGFPVDIHAAAEAVLLNSTLSVENQREFIVAEHALRWTVDNMQTAEGWFGYKLYPDMLVEAPYLRWGQAWMLRAYSEYFAARQTLSGSWGVYAPQGQGGRKAGPDARGRGAQKAQRDELYAQYREIGETVPENVVQSFAKELGGSSAYQGHSTQILDDSMTDGAHQILMPSSNAEYGSVQWAEDMFENAESDPWGHDWRASQQVRYDVAMDLLSRNVASGGVKDFIDVGCALGHFTSRLADYFGDARGLGVDISAEAVKKCNKMYVSIDFEVAKLPELELSKSQFDFVNALEVLCYVDEQSISVALERLRSILRPGGYLLVSSYLGKAPFYLADVFKKIISKRFTIIDEEMRHHNLYTQYESAVRSILDELSKEQSYALGGEAMKQFVGSGMNLLSDKSFLHKANDVARVSFGEKAASHIILLVRRDG